MGSPSKAHVRRWIVPVILALALPAAALAGTWTGPLEAATQRAVSGLESIVEPGPGLLPAAEAHRGKIIVASAVLTGPDTIAISYNGAIGPPTRQEDITQCGFLGCFKTGERTVKTSAGQYSGVTLSPGGSVDIREVRHRSNFAHTILLAQGFNAAPDASGTMHVPAGGTWSNRFHSHTRDAAQVSVSDGQGPSLAPGARAALDLSAGSLSFRFNERVTSASVDQSKVTVAGLSLADAAAVPFSGPSFGVTLTLTEAQRSELSSMQDDAGGLSADFARGAAADQRGNPSAAASGVGLSVVKDTTPPQVRAGLSSLDWGTGELEIALSEFIDASNIDLSGVRLQSGDGVASVSLAGARVSEAGGDRVTVQLSELQRAQASAPSAFTAGVVRGFVDADRFPDISGESRLESLSVDSGAFRDFAGIKNRALAGGSVGTLPDTSPPDLTGPAPSLHLDDGTMRMELSEYIDLRSSDAEKFSLVRADGNGAVSLAGAQLRSDGDTLILRMTEAQRHEAVSAANDLVKYVINNFDDLPREHQSIRMDNSLRLDMESAAVKDLSGNDNPDRPNAALTVHPDRSGPSLIRGSLDTGAGILTLEFSEVVVAGRIGLSDMSLRSPAKDLSQAVLLYSGSDRAAVMSESDSSTIQIRLTEAQRSALAGEGAGTLYLSVGSGAARDISDNPIGPDDMLPINSSADTSGPSVLSAALDGSAGVLSITFDETVDASAVAPASLHLRGADASDGRTSLASAAVRDQDSATVEITLTEAQRQAAFAYGAARLDAEAGAAKDTAYNPSSAASGVQVQASADGARPSFSSASFDAGSGTLRISFSETVKVSSIDLSKMVMHEAAVPLEVPEGANVCVMVLGGEYRMAISGELCTPPPPPRPPASVILSSSTSEASVQTRADSESVSVVLSGAQRSAVAAFERMAQLDVAEGAAADTSDNPVQAYTDASIVTDADDIVPAFVSAQVSGAHSITARFSEDLADATVGAGDFEVRGNSVAGVSERGGVVSITVQDRIVNTSGETVRVLMSGSVADEAGNILNGSALDVYVDAANDFNFAGVRSLVVESDNANPAYARAGDTIIVTFEADTSVAAASQTGVTFNSNPATTVSPAPAGFSATYEVTTADREGPVEISVSVTTASNPATSVFVNGDVTSGGVTVDMTGPDYLSATLAGSQSMHVYYSEQVDTSASDYTAIRMICDGCAPQDASAAANPGSSSHVLVSWSEPTPGLLSTPAEFTVGSGVTDLAGNPVTNPGRKEMAPPTDPEALSRLQLDALAGNTAGVALARDTLVHTVVSPPGTVPVIDISAFKQPDALHDGVLGAGGSAVEFPPVRGLTVETDMGTVTFPPKVQAGGFPSGDDSTITVDVSTKSPDAGFTSQYPDVDAGTALIFEFGRHDVDLAFSMPVRVVLSSDVPPGSTVFTIDSGGATREVLACGAGVIDEASAAAYIAASVAPLASPSVDGQACVDKAANTIWTLHFSAFGFAVQETRGGSECDDCTPPTIGVSESGDRRVSGGFSYNSRAVDVDRFFTPYERITVQVGQENTARFKVYDDDGPDSVRHVSLAFGLRSGQVISESTAAIAWERDHAGAETVSITDPHNVLDSDTVQVDASEVPCSAASADACLQVTFRHTFRAPPEFDIVGVDVRDAGRNSWQNYFNHGVRVEGESLNEQPGVLVNDGALRLYQIGSGDVVMTDGRGQLYILAPDDRYLPLTNASALYRTPDESMWIQSDPDSEPSAGYDRFDPRFAGLLEAEELEALEVLAAMVGGPVSNPEFGAAAPGAYHAQSYKDRSEDAALQEAVLAEQIRAALLYQQLFENRN